MDRLENSLRPFRFEQFRTTLRDGTPILIRPIRPDDKDLIRGGFERLSAESRYRRFLTPLNELGETDLAYLTEIDYVDHFAWAAVRADRPDEGLGVARFIRVKSEPGVAEAAVTVIDDYQGKGLGTVLLALLAVVGRSAGIKFFRAYVLETNQPMQELLEGLGAHTELDSPGVLRFDVPLDPDSIPDSPVGRVLKAVALQIVGPVASPFPM